MSVNFSALHRLLEPVKNNPEYSLPVQIDKPINIKTVSKKLKDVDKQISFNKGKVEALRYVVSLEITQKNFVKELREIYNTIAELEAEKGKLWGKIRRYHANKK